MSSTYTKLIKDATKAKPGAPKPKYIDPILASTFAQDGSLADVCRCLALRLRESNSIVVFKCLIIIHTMIRNGAVDNVLSHLSADQAGLKLKNISQGGNWQGYDAPPSLTPYAAYLDERIRSFRELKHDVIRSADGPSRSKSSVADGVNRLRRLKVEKGLLREVAFSQRVLSRLLDCSFFRDNLSDELNMTAFRMVLKDVLALYTAVNEGVINILEHYFEMSHTDASRALDVYKRFCRHTEKVVAYLAATRKASHSLSLTVPQLKHAPVSLAGALEEYLNDPAFEQNRKEYRENKRIADGIPEGSSSASAPAPSEDTNKGSEAVTKKEPTARKVSIQEPSAEDKTRPPKPPTNNQAIQDFFSTLESENIGSNTNGGQHAFSMVPQATGMAWFGSPDPSMGGGSAFGLPPQMTGYNPFMMMPQQTAMPVPPPPTGFLSQQLQQPSFLSAQQTAIPGNSQADFLAPQQTGYNPFRQSMMPQATGFPGSAGMVVPQVTGLGPAGAFDATPFTQQVQQQLAMQRMQKQQRTRQENGQQDGDTNGSTSPPVALSPAPPPQPASPAPKPLFAQKTGSRNPFAPPPGEKAPTPPPAVPKGPSLAELAFSGAGGFDGPTNGGGGDYSLGAGGWSSSTNTSAPASASLQGSQSQQQQSVPSGGLVPQKTGLLGTVASEFTAAGRANTPQFQQTSSSSTFNSQPNNAASTSNLGQTSPPTPLNGLTTGFSSISIGNGGGANSSSPFSAPSFSSPALLQAQPTGFAGSSVKPFKPESSFGTELASQYTGLPSSQGAGTQQQQQQQQQVGSGNPFASFATSQQPQPQPQPQASANGSTPATSFGSNLFHTNGNGTSLPLASQPTGFAGSSVRPFQPTSAFGSSAFGNSTGVTNVQSQAQAQAQGQAQAQPQPQTGTLF